MTETARPRHLVNSIKIDLITSVIKNFDFGEVLIEFVVKETTNLGQLIVYIEHIQMPTLGRKNKGPQVRPSRLQTPTSDRKRYGAS